MDPNCPFCQTALEPVVIGSSTLVWYQCPNPNCRCADNGMTLYENPHSPRWIDAKRRHIERKP